MRLEPRLSVVVGARLGHTRWKHVTEGAEILGYDGPLGLAPMFLAERQQRIVAPTILCVGGVPKQNKIAIEAEIENK